MRSRRARSLPVTDSEQSAIFPLSAVVFPGTAIPLRLFEDRYLVMMRDLLAQDSSLSVAICPILRGREVGGGDTRSDTATMCALKEVRVHDDGTYTLLAVGVYRVRVDTWLPDDPYPKGLVVTLRDEDYRPTADDIYIAHELATSILRRLGADMPLEATVVVADPAMSAFRIASLVPISDHDRHLILAEDNPSRRLQLCRSALEDLDAALTFRGR